MTKPSLALNPETMTKADWVLTELRSGVSFHFDGDLEPMVPAFAAIMQVQEQDLRHSIEEDGICETAEWSLADARPMDEAFVERLQ
jgi:hypothetical protein